MTGVNVNSSGNSVRVTSTTQSITVDPATSQVSVDRGGPVGPPGLVVPLDQLSNVYAISKEDGSVLKWDTTTSKWIPAHVWFIDQGNESTTLDPQRIIVDVPSDQLGDGANSGYAVRYAFDTRDRVRLSPIGIIGASNGIDDDYWVVAIDDSLRVLTPAGGMIIGSFQPNVDPFIQFARGYFGSDTGPEVRICDGDPNGILTASAASICFDYGTGQPWWSDDGTTWHQMWHGNVNCGGAP